MDRRSFIKTSAAGMTLPFWLQSCELPFFKVGYPIQLTSDDATGHQVMNDLAYPVHKKETVDVLIVGGGLSGLAAAYQLKERRLNFVLYELSDRLGGTSAAINYQGSRLAQGAHYDLDYPDHYGKEVIDLLSSLGIIQYQPWSRSWSFTDQQHIIPVTRRQQCYDDGEIRAEVIATGPDRNRFLELVGSFTDHMPLPIRLIDDKFRHLNAISFAQYLKDEMGLNAELKRQVDYHMMDDYGGRSDQVSALAGIHYFACRPYYREVVNLFSPPQGNDYFVQRLLGTIPRDKIMTQHLVLKIEKSSIHYTVDILDVKNHRIIRQNADQVIYAGQKHALKYIAPGQEKLFAHETAPWMVVSLVCNQKPNQYGHWQNEYLGSNKSFLGFIDSSVQANPTLHGRRVFTGYYCLHPGDRAYLNTIEEHKERIVRETQGYIESMLGSSIDPEMAFANLMGHAMPIPSPGYLFQDANVHPDAEMIYSGVDNGRLPLLFEALDSGIQAASVASGLR